MFKNFRLAGTFAFTKTGRNFFDFFNFQFAPSFLHERINKVINWQNIRLMFHSVFFISHLLATIKKFIKNLDILPGSFLYRRMLTELEKKIVASIQEDIPVVKRPYTKIAKQLDITEEILLKTLKKLCDKGVIRRFGATLRHQNSGFGSNAMAAWKVEEERVEEVGKKLASFRQVSHCYRRNPTRKWPYNLYTMVHARDEESCRKTVRMMSEAASVDSYAILFSLRELKKTSMKYFSTDI